MPNMVVEELPPYTIAVLPADQEFEVSKYVYENGSMKQIRGVEYGGFLVMMQRGHSVRFRDETHLRANGFPVPAGYVQKKGGK